MENNNTENNEFSDKTPNQQYKLKSKVPISIKISNSEKSKPESFEYSSNPNLVDNYKLKASNDINENNNNFLQKNSNSNSIFSTSVSTIDFKQKNEGYYLQMKINEIKQKIENLNKKINKKNLDMINLQDLLKQMKNLKDIKKLELENLLSNKESLEEILRVLVQDILNLNSLRNIYEEVSLVKNELINCPIQKLTEILRNIFEELKIINIEKINDIIKSKFENINSIKDENIELFLLEIVESLKKIISNENINETQLILMLKYIIKIVYLENKIQETFNYIKKQYKEQKLETKTRISELLNIIQSTEEKILELNNLLEELENKLKINEQNSRNKLNSNKFKKNLLLLKENEIENQNLRNSTSREKELKNPLLNNFPEKDLYKLSTPNNISTEYINIQTQTVPISTLNSSRLYKNLDKKNQLDESFCYYKVINKYDIKFNPLNSDDKNPEFFNYYKGLISIDFANKILLISDEGKKYNVKTLNLKIDFEQLYNIYISNLMKNIIKIHTLYLKYNHKCQRETNRNSSLNKFIHLKELGNINMDDNLKIKSALCKYFSFSLFIKDKILEIIFMNFDEFKNWFNGLSLLVNNNKKNHSSDKNQLIMKNILTHQKNKSSPYRFFHIGNQSGNIS